MERVGYTMYSFILVLIICIASSALVAYGINKAELWKNGEITIRKPSVLDLEDISDRYVINKYVKEVIGEYYEYCILKKEIERLQSDGADGLLVLFCPVLYWYAISEAMIDSFSDFSVFWAKVISVMITLLVTVLPFIIISKFFPKDVFDASEQEFIENYKARGATPNYPISERMDINIYILSRHHWFLFCIQDREKTRHTLKIIGYILAFFAIIIALTITTNV